MVKKKEDVRKLSKNEKLLFRSLSPDEIDEIVRDAEKIRARAMADLVSYLGHALKRAGVWAWSVVQGLFAAMAEAREARRLYEGLSQMSDHQLVDIGLRRADIPAIVAGTFNRLEAKPDKGSEKAEEALEFEYKEAA